MAVRKVIEKVQVHSYNSVLVYVGLILSFVGFALAYFFVFMLFACGVKITLVFRSKDANFCWASLALLV